MSNTRFLELAFNREDAAALTFSDDTLGGVTADGTAVALRDRGVGYPAAVTVRSRVTPAARVLALAGWDDDVDADGTVTAVDYRMALGGTDYYWTGSAWTAASGSQWSPAADVRAHLATLPLPAAPGSRTYQVVARLRSTDPARTPRLRRVTVAYETDVTEQEDLLLESLLPLLQGIRGETEYQTTPAAAAVSLAVPDLATYQLTGVPAAYDITADPHRRAPLPGTFDGTAKTFTLGGGALPAGHALRLTLQYAPRGYYQPSQDLPDLSLPGKIPALALEDLRPAGGSLVPGGTSWVGNREAGTALTLDPPRRYDAVGTLLLLTTSTRELLRLQAAVMTALESTPVLVSPATGQRYDLRVTAEPDGMPRYAVSEIHGARLEFQVSNFQVYTRPASAAFLVRKFVPTLR